MKRTLSVEHYKVKKDSTLDIQRNFDLTRFNTMGVASKATFFVTVTSLQELKDALAYSALHRLQIMILGGGSNILFVNHFDGLVINMKIKGESIISQDDKTVLLKVMAGENWHQLVMRCVERGWGGIENLSLIPGSVGAAPIQNIGAYGVELKDVLHHVEFLNIETLEEQSFTTQECQFGYRNSIFKNELKGKVIITSVSIKLNKHPQINTEYRVLADLLKEKGIEKPAIKEVSDAVIEIRESKLPDPAIIGNTGSFFKNPIIPILKYQELKNNFPNIPCYPISDAEVKLPAAWLIDKAGWKGKRKGDAGIHHKQALVLVNHGKASGKQLWNFALEIKADVLQKFGVEIEPEVNVII